MRCFTLEVVVQELAELVVLLGQIRKVNEEPAAHVSLHGLDLLWPGWPVILHQEIAVFQQTSTSDLLGTFGGDQLFVKVIQSIVEIAVDGLSDDRGVEIV